MIYSTDYNNLPNIFELREMLLKIQKSYPVLHLKPFEQEIEDRHKYIVTPLRSGRYSFKPNITKQGLLYHGSNNFGYKEFKPSLYQDEHTDLILEGIKLEALLITMKSFPLFSLLMDGVIVDGKKKVCVYNPIGLAACYGYKTPFVQLTSDLDTAIMYAITGKTDSDLRRYLSDRDGMFGVVYVFELYDNFGQISGLSTLGLQPFDRSSRLNQFQFKMSSKMDFNRMDSVKGFVFKHNASIEHDVLQIIRRPKLTDLLSLKLNSIFSKVAGKYIIPFEALYNYANKNGINENQVSRLINKYEKIDKSIIFVDQAYRQRFNETELNNADLETRWLQMCSKLCPIIPSDQILIDKLTDAPRNPMYSKYFNVDEWLDYNSRPI